MRIEEYRQLESQAMDALQRLRENGINRGIGILMSHEVYDMARFRDNSAYAVSAGDFREIYWGYDVYVISEVSPPIFSPVLVRFPEDFDPNQLDAGTFLIYESDDGSLRVYSKSEQERALFCETEFTVCQAHRMERVTFADRIRAGRERQRWSDWVQYTTPQPDFLAEQPTYNEFIRQLNQIAATMQSETRGATPKRKKAPPRKDWDERLTPEDTKELDEFLNSLARKGTLESAT